MGEQAIEELAAANEDRAAQIARDGLQVLEEQGYEDQFVPVATFSEGGEPMLGQERKLLEIQVIASDFGPAPQLQEFSIRYGGRTVFRLRRTERRVLVVKVLRPGRWERRLRRIAAEAKAIAPETEE